MSIQHLHGELLQIKQTGTLILGPSGCGKSDLALLLLDRGHRLVADDMVEIRQSGSDTVCGCAPSLLQGQLHLRDLGVLDVATVYGANALLNTVNIELIIELKTDRQQDLADYDPLTPRWSEQQLLQVVIPKVTISIQTMRPIHLLVETMCTLYQQQTEHGIKHNHTLLARHQAALDK